jgi:conjugal transfer pilus assembly protein TraL
VEHEELFQFLRYLDEPKRFLGLTVDDCIIGGLTIFLVMFSRKFLIVLAGVAIRSVLRKMKKGNSPNYLLMLMYWYFPHAITKYFIKGLPPSHQRYWIS